MSPGRRKGTVAGLAIVAAAGASQLVNGAEAPEVEHLAESVVDDAVVRDSAEAMYAQLVVQEPISPAELEQVIDDHIAEAYIPHVKGSG